MDNDIKHRKALYEDVMNAIVALVDEVLDGAEQDGLTTNALDIMTNINERLAKDLDVPILSIGNPMGDPDQPPPADD